MAGSDGRGPGDDPARLDADVRRAIEWDCARLVSLYANLNDAADWAGVAALYAEDGVMTRPTAPDAPIFREVIAFGPDGSAVIPVGSGFARQEVPSGGGIHYFGLATNAALVKIGAIVHYLEAHDTPVPEAAGVQTLLQGAARRSTSDDELLGEAEKTFDLLYEAYFEAPAS